MNQISNDTFYAELLLLKVRYFQLDPKSDEAIKLAKNINDMICDYTLNFHQK